MAYSSSASASNLAVMISTSPAGVAKCAGRCGINWPRQCTIPDRACLLEDPRWRSQWQSIERKPPEECEQELRSSVDSYIETSLLTGNQLGRRKWGLHMSKLHVRSRDVTHLEIAIYGNLSETCPHSLQVGNNLTSGAAVPRECGSEALRFSAPVLLVDAGRQEASEHDRVSQPSKLPAMTIHAQRLRCRNSP